MNFVAGVLTGETSGGVEITEEAMEVLAPIFGGPFAKKTIEALASILELSNFIVAAVPPPIEVTDMERKFEEEPRLAPVSIPEDATMELVVESSASVLGDREIESFIPSLGDDAVGEGFEPAVLISALVSSKAGIPILEVPSPEPELIAEKAPPQESMAPESIAAVTPPRESVAPEFTVEEPRSKRL